MGHSGEVYIHTMQQLTSESSGTHNPKGRGEEVRSIRDLINTLRVYTNQGSKRHKELAVVAHT